jgi:hypothetical protein
MEAICSSETSVDTQRTTRRYIPEDGTPHNHRCENLKFYITSGSSVIEVACFGLKITVHWSLKCVPVIFILLSGGSWFVLETYVIPHMITTLIYLVWHKVYGLGFRTQSVGLLWCEPLSCVGGNVLIPIDCPRKILYQGDNSWNT